MGRNPQNDQVIDKWGCSIAFMPILQIENSQQTRQAGAAVESMRNAVVSEAKRAYKYHPKPNGQEQITTLEPQKVITQG